ncbi:hypothetical protein [Candidatus Foliamicus sp.]
MSKRTWISAATASAAIAGMALLLGAIFQGQAQQRSDMAAVRAELRSGLGEVNARFGEVNARFGEVNMRLDNISGDLAALRERVARIEGHLALSSNAAHPPAHVTADGKSTSKAPGTG